MTAVNLSDVGKRYKKKWVVKGFNLRIEDGEFMVFVGPSGCGKSTVLRMIAGLEEISAGTIEINQRIANDLAPKDRHVAMVFQNYALYPHMTVYENLAFALKMHKVPQDQIFTLVREAADILELTPLLERKPSEISGGQRQRVAMGRAIVRRVQVFLFDEPLSNLDAQLRTQMRREIKRLHNKLKSTMIYVTHDQIEAMTLADRIVVMKDGDIHQAGSPIDVYQNPVNVFVAGFIGSPHMNLFPATFHKIEKSSVLEAEHWTIPFSPKGQWDVLPGQEVILGIRPNDIRLATPHDSFPQSWLVEGTLKFVEILGKQVLMHVIVGGTTLQALVDNVHVPKIGEPVRLAFDRVAIHLFDAATQKTLKCENTVEDQSYTNYLRSVA